MTVRGDASDRRALAIVTGVVFGGVLLLAVLGADGDADVALAARRAAEQRQAAQARAQSAEGGDRADVGVAALLEVEAGAQAPDVLRRAAAAVAYDDADIAGLVEDLRDDGVRWNGTHAMRRLLSLPPGRVPELERALTSADAQQRGYAAAVLRLRHLEHGGEPCAELLTMSVAALRRDSVDRNIWGTLGMSPRVASVRFLSGYADRARDELLRAIDSPDEQQRFFAAWLLAQAGIRDRAARCAFVLVEHLRDNDIEGDAMVAANGLFRLGPAALPVMALARRHADEQMRRLLDLIELDLRSPPTRDEHFRARQGMHGVTSLYHDPAIQFDVHRSVVPMF